jgi:glycosyltransferase involved in cell wall biosynthesis
MKGRSFSIIVPTYQRKAIVTDAVKAISRVVSSGELELLVIVDGSMDGTADGLRQMRCPFPYRVIEQANQGAGAARNRGAAQAAGEILLFLDDDEPLLKLRRWGRCGAGASSLGCRVVARLFE